MGSLELETPCSFYFKTQAVARPAVGGHWGKMEALGAYHELLPPARALAQLGFIAALLLTAWLERVQFRLRASEASRWWASNGRDVLNAVAVATLWLALWLLGFSGPVALGAASVLALVANLLQEPLGRSGLPGWGAYLLMLAIGAPVLIAPGAVHALLRATVERLG